MLLVPGDAAFCCDQNLLSTSTVFLVAYVVRGPWNGGEPREPKKQRNHEMFWWGIGCIVTAVCILAYHVFFQHLLRISYDYLLELAFFLVGVQFVLRSYGIAEVTADAAAVAGGIALAVLVVYEVGFGNIVLAGFVLWSLWYALDL